MVAFPTEDSSSADSHGSGALAGALKRSKELFRDHGCLLIKNAFSPDYIEQRHAAYVETYKSYFQDREFSDALNVGDKRIMLTVDINGPFNSPQLYANRLVLPLLEKLLEQRPDSWQRRLGRVAAGINGPARSPRFSGYLRAALRL